MYESIYIIYMNKYICTCIATPQSARCLLLLELWGAGNSIPAKIFQETIELFHIIIIFKFSDLL